MTDLELAVSTFLPEVWRPGRKCEWRCPDQAKDAQFMMLCQCGAIDIPSREHDIPCPPATPELGFRLLEAMKGGCYWNSALSSWSIDSLDVHNICHDPDLLTAIIKAAAALAEKDQ